MVWIYRKQNLLHASFFAFHAERQRRRAWTQKAKQTLAGTVTVQARDVKEKIWGPDDKNDMRAACEQFQDCSEW